MHRRKPVQTKYSDHTPTHEERLDENHRENCELLDEIERHVEIAKAYVHHHDRTVAEIEAEFELPPGGVGRVLQCLGLKVDRPEK